MYDGWFCLPNIRAPVHHVEIKFQKGNAEPPLRRRRPGLLKHGGGQVDALGQMAHFRQHNGEKPRAGAHIQDPQSPPPGGKPPGGIFFEFRPAKYRRNVPIEPEKSPVLLATEGRKCCFLGCKSGVAVV